MSKVKSLDQRFSRFLNRELDYNTITNRDKSKHLAGFCCFMLGEDYDVEDTDGGISSAITQLIHGYKKMGDRKEVFGFDMTKEFTESRFHMRYHYIRVMNFMLYHKEEWKFWAEL